MCCRTSHPDQPSQASTNQDCAAWVWKSLELFRTYTKNPEVTFGVPNRRDQPATLDQPKPFQTPSLLPLGLPNLQDPKWTPEGPSRPPTWTLNPQLGAQNTTKNTPKGCLPSTPIPLCPGPAEWGIASLKHIYIYIYIYMCVYMSVCMYVCIYIIYTYTLYMCV